MNNLYQTFEKSLKNYKGKNADLLSVDNIVPKLQQELPPIFNLWMKQEYLDPIAKVVIEVDQLGYVYASLFDDRQNCLLSEGACHDMKDLGLHKIYKKSPELVTQFLAVCYRKVLPELCKTPEFLNLPRASKIVFSVSEHSGWEYDEVYVFKGKPNIVDHGNVILKRLSKATNCHTEPGTIERKFMDNMGEINVQSCANELTRTFEKFLIWLKQQNPTPVEAIVIAWSSNFDEKPAIGAYCAEDILHRFILSDDLYNWFPEERPTLLDADNLAAVRYCVSCKIAQIACLMMEKVSQLGTFQAIPKQKKFVMEVVNRTAGSPPVFYRE
ncbi:hypothetical protein [Flavobacterium sp. HNIBRBA15423]|uniref:hypothetical protein n=1 Tax=Flavobacterium sp. HNIBRBA15423 TaxID=3458683 RepID=UPI004044F32C